jgi:hypothetical protein
MKFNIEHWKNCFQAATGYTWEQYKTAQDQYHGSPANQAIYNTAQQVRGAYACFYPSTPTCGLGELGAVTSIDASPTRMCMALWSALAQKRGLVQYCIFERARRPMAYDSTMQALLPFGFTKILTFYNPNSGNNVEMYGVQLPPLSEVK